jgi:uncharacterized membrane protein YeaQ/YmgE (transglycosylase-associated protein family)
LWHEICTAIARRVYSCEKEIDQMRFIGWLVVGLIAGLLARLFVPGRQPMGCAFTVVIGLAGSLVGGFLASMIWGVPDDGRMIHPTGFIGSTIGAVIVLLAYGYSQRPRV